MSGMMFWLSDSLVKRCDEYAESVCRSYLNGDNVRSRNLSSRDAEKRVDVQSLGKRGECIACLALGIDVDRLNWIGSDTDTYDILWRGRRIDVKTTGLLSRFLLWPANKTFFQAPSDVPFDALALVKSDGICGRLMGAISSGEFLSRCETIGSDRKYGLDPGTRVVDESMLHEFPIDDYKEG